MQHALDQSALGEADIVEAARAGDTDAFQAIMQRHNQHLFRVARAIVRDEVEAEDVLQEAYVRAFTGLAGFRGGSAIATWLTRIVINEARTRLRARKTTVGVGEIDKMSSSGGEVIGFPGRATDPEADVAGAQIRRLLEAAVDQLPPTFRMVFILRDVEELSIEETADQLGVKPETVKTRLHRARRLLREALRAQVSGALVGAYPFLGARCERMTTHVLDRLRVTGVVRA